MNEFREAERAQQSFLAPLEKKCLIWLARRTPKRIRSDHLSALGLASLAGAGLSYWAASRDPNWLLCANVFLALNWLGDSLDGTLARVRNQERPRYGFYIDHIIDAAGTLFLLSGLGLSGYMSPSIAAGLLIIYYLLSIETYLATYTLGTFHISFWKFSPTELRVLLAIGNIALLYSPVAHLGGFTCLLFDAGGAAGIAGMTLMLMTAATKHAAALYRAEPLPKDIR